MALNRNAAAGLARWHEIVRSGDAAALPDLLDPDAVFWSPVVHSPQRGRDLVVLYLTGAMHVLMPGGFHYVREVADGDDAVLEFESEVAGMTVNGVDMIHFTPEGRIDDFKVMLRPMRGLLAVKDAMAALLQAGT